MACPARAGEPSPPTQAVFCVDFGTHPPRGNLDIRQEHCLHTLRFDEFPHLTFLDGARSRLIVRFTLPERPIDAQLCAEHLTSDDGAGTGYSPIAVAVNDETLVENFSPGGNGYVETRWRATDLLRSGDNQIEWQSRPGKTHYWLRRIWLHVRFARPVSVAYGSPRVEPPLFLEDRFSQCSFNALATVLDHFHGVPPGSATRGEVRAEFERRTFLIPLEKSTFGEYFGWAPWTSFLVQSGTVEWNGNRVDDLVAERFSLAPRQLPLARADGMLVRYQDGEEMELVARLLEKLAQGPAIIWTPYAAALDEGPRAWRHVRSLPDGARLVRYEPRMTHSVVVHRENGRLWVYDGSRWDGIHEVEPETVVATAAAMVGNITARRAAGEDSLLTRPLRGVAGTDFNVVFYRGK